ncbi:P-loop NTPase [Desulfurivibrio alkaliphilus]|uniref:MinD-related ATP-binding protein n=1 Tax=Desulfurivibrio alkaliphilus (strain DSM 19089 / UNIQEM U267 / AHT2) TaxID=589865 RepID=D6Z488_DESAT|nr:P-loop NTPase [Desulfurivibrio alkaliphilus]ADH86363.1 MinD-related ATP-binding protein [Desulfurivibrio alkaliphilus AHT 2]
MLPVASGKGGAGKSIFAASLAIALARQGARVVAADLDLGGSNLHTYLGLPNTNPGVGDFLKQQRQELRQLLIPTPFDNLRFLPGDGKTPFMANIPSKQRFLLLSQLQQLPADYVIIDLGAGSALNTMNLFGLAKNGIVITTLDTPAMMNALVFLRNFMFANLISLTAHQAPIKKDLLAAYRRSADGTNLTVAEAYRLIEQRDPLLARETRKRCGSFCPRLVYNMADEAEELQVAGRIEGTMKKNLSLQCSTLGLLFHDPAVRQAVRKNRVFLQSRPDTPYARGLAAITQRILHPPATAPTLKELVSEAKTHQSR